MIEELKKAERRVWNMRPSSRPAGVKAIERYDFSAELTSGSGNQGVVEDEGEDVGTAEDDDDDDGGICDLDLEELNASMEENDSDDCGDDEERAVISYAVWKRLYRWLVRYWLRPDRRRMIGTWFRIEISNGDRRIATTHSTNELESYVTFFLVVVGPWFGR